MVLVWKITDDSPTFPLPKFSSVRYLPLDSHLELYISYKNHAEVHYLNHNLYQLFFVLQKISLMYLNMYVCVLSQCLSTNCTVQMDHLVINTVVELMKLLKIYYKAKWYEFMYFSHSSALFHSPDHKIRIILILLTHSCVGN